MEFGLATATKTYPASRPVQLQVQARLVLLLVAVFGIRTLRSETFTLGYLTGSQRPPGDREYSRPGLTISGAISLAVEQVNGGRLAQLGHQLNFVVAETYGVEVISVQKTAELWTRNVSAYIGPQETCEHEAFMAAAFNVPMISYYCAHYAMSDKSKFPTFARTRPPDTQISKSVASVLTEFNWTHITVLYLKSEEYEFGNVAKAMMKLLPQSGVTIASIRHWDSPYHHGYMDNPFRKLVEETHKFTRSEYAVLGVDIEQYDPENPSKYLRGLLQDSATPRDPRIVRAYQNYIGVVPSSPLGFDNFTLLVNAYMERPPFNFPNPLSYFGKGKLIRAEAAYLYDAVIVYAEALIKVMDSGSDPRNGTAIIESLKNMHYRSAMGYMVYIDENGDAEGNYTLLARQPLKGGNQDDRYGLYPSGLFALPRGASRLPILQMTESIDWIGGKPPIAIPACGFDEEKCITYTLVITSGVAGGVVATLSVIALILFRNWKYEQELDSLLWKVDYRDIQTREECCRNSAGSRILHGNRHSAKTSHVSLSSNPDTDFRYSTLFAPVGVYKGRVVAIKKLNKRSVDVTREMKKELKMMRDLRHDNLNPFVGACTEPPNVCVITEYCPRGSLRDILENDDVKLDAMFVASLVGDILNGMIYLHDSPLHHHGALHTSNCLVDSRWVVKICDFGLTDFKKTSADCLDADSSNAERKCHNRLYRAPELLRLDRECDSAHGTQKGDVYSFGIILYEVYDRRGPFGKVPLSPRQILDRVVHCDDPSASFRPCLRSLTDCPDFVKSCMRECWSETPYDRPDFKTVRSKLRPLRKGMKPNIFDNMMALMEKYANNLEVLVDERTDQLQEEKRKTEALLYEMLPKTVADQLKRGHKVEAESFDCVTIYFSDIVGFTSMAAECTPLQVVNFLNDLYTCFDSIIENYDVYKVETIGDAYMVVSGLPLRNDIQHASEIATMSLRLLSTVRNFTIKHRPDDRLKLRIGIHSGPVCAGVVGLKMPRYCLFGDTVNTASRMESTGLPLKVHCSKPCRDLLVAMGGYYLVERGLINLKGKGDQRTYWLLDEDPCARRLRTFAREKRRAESGARYFTTYPDVDGYRAVIRSSLKNKTNPGISRCTSFESSKKLRFAAGHGKVLRSNQLLLMPSLDAQHVPMTMSCPCMENLFNAATPTERRLDGGAGGKSAVCRSVPALCCHLLVVPRQYHAISAPSSPNKSELALPTCFETPQDGAERAPLLQVTTPDHYE
ncbi:guanylate cyclase 32E isoform X2 [Cylas formicarius]|uniref:guanylate cyclase 32E isoform X2 n=1 Tax=Cylas formicarius TaxID=197179 RepID=UPI0029588B81|nr:guanylate cyclase 32E isoform X2 [Cylas formicarius]